VGVDLVIHDRVRRPSSPFKLAGGFESRVVCLELHPGFHPAILDSLVQNGVRGLVLRAYGSGNVPVVADLSLVPAIERAVKAGIAVVIVSQVQRGGVDLSLYESGAHARSAGAVDGGDLTTSAAVVKLMYALQGGGVEHVRALFGQDLRGEGGVPAGRVG